MVAAIIAGGLPAVEVTATTPGAEAAIKSLSQSGRGGNCLGIGSVVTAEQVDRFVDAGASYIVTPALNEAVIEAGQRRGVNRGGRVAAGGMSSRDDETW